MDTNTILAYAIGGPLMLAFLSLSIIIPIRVLRLTTRPANENN